MSKQQSQQSLSGSVPVLSLFYQLVLPQKREQRARELKRAFTPWTEGAAGRSSPDLVSSSKADVGDEMQGERRALRAARKGGSQTLHAGAG